MLALVVGVAILSGGAGYLASSYVKNPQSLAAEAAPPPRSRITVPVEARALSNDVITRVGVGFSNSSTVQINTAGAAALVTGRVPEKGNLLEEGTMLIEVSERPYFILEGELPTFRSLRPGNEGADVLQLETALERLGFFTGTPDSLYDSETEDAVAAMYDDEGYDPPEPDATEKQQVKSAEELVKNAEQQVELAREALAEAKEQAEPTESQRLTDTRMRVAIDERLTAAEEAAANWQASIPEIAQARAAEELAREQYEEANERWIKANSGVHPDTDQTPTTEEVEEFSAIRTQSVKAVNAAVEEINEAIAESDGGAAAREELAYAQETHRIEIAQWNETHQAPDFSNQEEAVADAEEGLQEAQEDLAEVQAEIGVWLPDYEFTFLPSLPRRINRVLVNRGDFVSSSSAIIDATGAELRINGGLTEDRRPLVNAGDRVILTDTSLGIEVTGKIDRLDDAIGLNNEFSSRYYFTVVLDEAQEFDIDELVSVGNFRTLIPLERTEGEVLTVPPNALSTAADGVARVEVERNPDEPTEIVNVTVGLVPKGGGYVEVIPFEGGLEVGDQVVIGFDNRTASNTATSSDEAESDNSDAESDDQADDEAESSDDETKPDDEAEADDADAGDGEG